MAPLFKPGLVFLSTVNLAAVKTEIEVRVEESKGGLSGRARSTQGCPSSWALFCQHCIDEVENEGYRQDWVLETKDVRSPLCLWCKWSE